MARTITITAPEPLVTMEEVRAHLRLDTLDEVDVLEGQLAAACASIDGPDGWLGRAIGKQTLEARLDGFPYAPVTLAFPPIATIVSVGYIDPTGTAATMPPAAYRLIDRDLLPVWGTYWPDTLWDRETVQVRYTAGYDTLPPAIRAAVLLMVGDLFNNRETTIDAKASAAGVIPMSTTVENLLRPYRLDA